MDDALELAAFEPAKQIRRRNKIGELVLLQVAPLAVFAERVVHRDIVAPGLIEARDDVRPDETCSARYQQHACRDPAFRAHHCPTPSGGATRGQPQWARCGTSTTAGLTPAPISKITVNSMGWSMIRRVA